MTTDNKPEDGVVENDNTQQSKEVETNGTGQSDVLDELFDTGVQKQTPSSADKKPEDGAEKPAEGGTSDNADGDGTPAKETPKTEEKSEEGESPFYKVGTRTFKTKEDLDEFVNKQVGYNGYLTGAFKKLHPEYFNADGSIDHTKLSNIKKETSKVEDAAQTVKEMEGRDPKTMSNEEKADLEKAQAILRPVLESMGVAFKSDPDFQKVHEVATQTEAANAEEARTVVETFVSDHPLVNEHRVELGKFMQKNEIEDIDKAWTGYKALNGIDEQLPNKGGGKKVNTSVDKNIPVVIKKNVSGNTPPPSGGEPDFFDDLIGAKGMR